MNLMRNILGKEFSMPEMLLWLCYKHTTGIVIYSIFIYLKFNVIILQFVDNVQKFCREQLLLGKAKTHKGWYLVRNQ